MIAERLTAQLLAGPPAREVVLEPFAPLASRDAGALRADASDVVRHLGASRSGAGSPDIG